MTEMLMARLMTVIEFIGVIGITALVVYLYLREQDKYEVNATYTTDSMIDDPSYLMRVAKGNDWKTAWLNKRLKEK